MLPDVIRTMLSRDLRALVREVEAYPDDSLLWRTVPGVSNSAGTLALHLAGNLQHFIGAVLGQTGFVRDRKAEFSLRDLTRTQLRVRIEATAEAVDATLAKVTAKQCQAEYPILIGDHRVRTAEFLVHLVAHLSYHLGQIDYHRRFLVADARPVEAVSIGDLPVYASTTVDSEPAR